MIRMLFFMTVLFFTNTLLANEVNKFSEHLSNTITNSVISDSNLQQSDIQIYAQKVFNLEVKSTNIILNSTIQNNSNVYQNVINIEKSSLSNVVINSQNIIENSTINNSTVTQGSITIGR